MDVVKKISEANIIALDFETATGHAPHGYNTSLIPYEAKPEAASIAWGKVGEVVGECWTFDFTEEHGRNLVSWEWFCQELLRPIWVKQDLTLIMHGGRFDVQIGIKGLYPHNMSVGQVYKAMPRGRVHDTLVMSHLLDENTPNDLKSLAKYYLDKPRKTYKQTEKERKNIIKAAEARVRGLINDGWLKYQASKKNTLVMEKGLLNTTNEDDLLIYSMPEKLIKATFAERMYRYVGPKIEDAARKEAAALFATYAVDDALDTLNLFYRFWDMLQELPDLRRWYEQVELPFALLMAEWEIGGMRIDTDFLYFLERDVEALIEMKRAYLQNEVHTQYGMEDFNPNSHAQIKNLIWDQLQLSPPEWAKTTKTGYPQSNAAVLNYLAAEGHPICQRLASLSALRTLHSTFLSPIYKKSITNSERRYRFSFNSLGAVTGRMSSSPNSMNIPNPDKMPVEIEEVLAAMHKHEMAKWENRPITPSGWVELDEGELGSSGFESNGTRYYRMQPLRKAFIPRPGSRFVIADYSQIELRMITHISQDPTLLRAYRQYDCECGASGETDKPLHWCPECKAPEGRRDKTHPEQPVINGFCLGLDIHSLTALKLGLMEKYGYKQGRQYAKTINFGLCYGESYFTLAKDLDVSEEAAHMMYYDYFRAYPMVKVLLDHVLKQTLRSKGVFPYILRGRERRFLAQKEKLDNGTMKKWELRAVIREIANNIPQGSAIDIVKLGILRYSYRKRRNPNLEESYVCNAIHDECIVDVPEVHAEECNSTLRISLEGAAQLSIPILVDSKICKNWAEGK